MNLHQEGEFSFIQGNDKHGIPLEAYPNTPNHQY
jgi:hypothetical protein